MRESGVDATGSREGAARGPLLVLAAGALWGLNGLYVQVLTAAGLGPTAIVFARYVCALALLWPQARLSCRREGYNVLVTTPFDVACCVAMGLASNALGGVLCARAVARVGASTTTVLLYTAPVFGCLLARWLYGEALTRRKLVAIGLDFAGVLMVVAAGGGLSLGGLPADGVAAGLGYGLSYSLVAVLSQPVAGRCHPLAIVWYGTLTVVLVAAVPALGSGELVGLLAPGPALAALLYGAGSTVFANLLYQGGMALGVEASRVAVITSVEVAISTLVGALVLGEGAGASKLMGVCCVLASIAVMNAGAPTGEAHGVRPSYGCAFREALSTSDDLSQAVNDLRTRREQVLSYPER